MTNPDPPILPDALQSLLDKVAAPYVTRLSLRVVAVRTGEVELSLPVSPEIVHGGGVVCGQELMAAADTAMILAVTAAIGGFRPMTTVQLQTSFLRPVPGDAPAVVVIAKLLRRGRQLCFGEILLSTPEGGLAAHATTTYALL